MHVRLDQSPAQGEQYEKVDVGLFCVLASNSCNCPGSGHDENRVMIVKNDSMKSEKMSKKAVSISGKVGDDGKTFVSDKDSKPWKVSNPEALKGHEGHHLTIRAHVNADKDEVHVTSVKMAGEMKDTMKKDEMHR
jgi:hypothetical protein